MPLFFVWWGGKGAKMIGTLPAASHFATRLQRKVHTFAPVSRTEAPRHRPCPNPACDHANETP